jgi:Flp pilus assembly protein TadB
VIRHFVMGGCFGLGIWLLVRGMFPAPVTLAERLARHADSEVRPDSPTALRSLWGRIGLWLLRNVKGEVLDQVDADLAVTGRDLESHAVDKLNAGIGGAVLITIFLTLLGLIGSGLAIVVVLVVGFALSYLVPDVDLRRQAATRREEFSEALNAFVSLVAVSISGGSGVNTAMDDVVGIGGGWCFDALRQSIEEANLHGESPWAGFDRLGRRLGVVPLIELAGALSLAGNSGARVTETLRARAASGQERELAEALASAEKKSESLNIPVAAMVLGWVVFMGYPAVVNLLGA